MPYNGKNMYIYWGHTATFKSGDPSTQKHIPFNLLKVVPTAADELQEKTSPEYMANSEVPQVMVEQLIATGKITLQAYFRDPWMMLQAFTYRTYPASWTGTSDTITGDFTAVTHLDYIWMQIHIPDQVSTNHQNYLFDGGVVIEYKWIIEAGKGIIEEFTIEFAEFATNTQACDIDDGLDDGTFDRAGVDGGWGMWDAAYSASSCAHSKDATITFNGSAISDLNMKKCTIGMKLNKTFEPVTSSKNMALVYNTTREYYMDCEGVLQSTTTHAQALTVYSSKTKGICKVVFGKNTLQFTIGYLDNIEKMVDVAEGLKAQEVVFHYKGGSLSAASCQWTGAETTDPTAILNGLGV